MPEQPTVAIIIPTWNGLEHLKPCLESLAALAYPADRLEIILSDNASSDGTLEWVSRRWPAVRVVQNGAQVGFGRACNQAATATRADFVAFLNNDTRVEPGWLAALLAARAAGGGAACVAAHLKSWDGREEDFSGAAANLFGSGRQGFVRGWPDRPGPPNPGEPILFACGAAMLIERQVFLDAGGFDPGFFMYFEDVDLGWRLWVLGHRVVYAPDAVVYHRGGGTTGADRAPSHRRYFQFEANTLATIVKNYEAANLDRVLPAALALELKRALLAAGEHVDPAHYRLGGKSQAAGIAEGRAELPPVSVAHILATGAWVARLPALMRERARIQARRRRPDAAILPLFGRPFAPQFAGPVYAEAQRRVLAALDLYPVVAASAPNRVLVLAGEDAASQERAQVLGSELGTAFQVVIAPVGGTPGPPAPEPSAGEPGGDVLTRPFTSAADPALRDLAATADLIIAVGSGLELPGVAGSEPPLAFDVTPWPDAGAAPPQLRTLAAGRADLLVAATPEQAATWGTAAPVATTPDALRAFARSPHRRRQL